VSSKGKHKAMHRNGTKRRWSENSALPGATSASADHLRRHAEHRQASLVLESKDSRVYRKLSGQAMNAASMREQLPTDSGTYTRAVVKQKQKQLQQKQITHRTLFLRNGAGYRDAMVFASNCVGFWYCEYDCERGSFVSEQRFTDKELFRFEREHNLIKMRPVTIREKHFIIIPNTRV